MVAEERKLAAKEPAESLPDDFQTVITYTPDAPKLEDATVTSGDPALV